MKSLPIAILAAGTTAALSAAQDLSDRVVHLAQGCLSFRTGAQRRQADYRKRRRHLRFRPCRLLQSGGRSDFQRDNSILIFVIDS